MSVTIESDLKEILIKFEQKLDKIDDRLNRIEITQTEIKGQIKSVDEKLSGQIKALDKRMETQEFVSRGVLVGLILAILGGAAKLFGFVGNP